MEHKIDHTRERSNRVKSIEKALNILDLLDREHELSLGDISEKLDMDKGTAHRLLSTLKFSGYIDQNPVTRKYANSFKLFEMGNNVADKIGVRKVASKHIESASALAGETINLGIIQESNVIYIDKIESHETIKVGLNIGKKIPVYCTGLGKAMLAFMTSEQSDKILKDIFFERFTSHTTTNRQTLDRQLIQIRTDGFFIDDEEYVEGLICIAAPIFDHTGHPVAAVSVSVPKYRYAEASKCTNFIEIIKETAAKISRDLGYKQ